MSKPGTRDKKRDLGETVSVDRFDISNVCRDEGRISMSHTLTLAGIKQDPNFHYRFFANKDNRLEQAMAGGYEVVRDGAGTPIVRHKGLYDSYCMKIPKELRQIDLDKKAQAVNNTIKERNSLKEGQYIPGKQDGTREFALERDRSSDFTADEFDNLA